MLLKLHARFFSFVHSLPCAMRETRDTSSFAFSPGIFWFDLAQPKAVAQHGLTRPYLNYKKIRLSLERFHSISCLSFFFF